MSRARTTSIAVGIAALFLAGCSGSPGPSGETAQSGSASGTASASTSASPSGQSSSPDGTVEVSVLDTAGMPSAFLQYGIEEGFFDDEGLDVSLDVSVGGAAAVPTLVSGDTQFAGSNSVSALLAASRGLPIRVVSAGTRAAADPERDFARIVVPEDSDIRGPEDLEGATVAVNTLKNINDVVIKSLMDDAGADGSAVEFAEMGFPDMLPALEEGQVDAALLIEPFVALSERAGNRGIASPYAETKDDLMVGTYLTTDEYAQQNPDVVEAFRRGVSATGRSIAEDPDAFREALPDLTTIDAEVARDIELPVWDAEVDTSSLDFLNDRMVQYGLIDEPVDVASLTGP